MKKLFVTLLPVLCLLLAGLVVPAAAQQKPVLDKAAAGKIVQMLEATGLNYSKASENVWLIRYKGDQIGEFNVLVIGHEGMLILTATIAEKKALKLTVDALQKLMVLNDDFDRVKVGIDSDGDLFVRTDLTLRIVDAQELQLNLEQISGAADGTFATIKPFLTGPRRTEK